MPLSARRAGPVWAGLVLASLTVVAPSSGQTPSTAVITTKGQFTRRVRPDLATVSLSFTADGRTALEAGLRVAARADTLRLAFQGLGIPRDSLLSGHQWYWWRGRVERILGQPKYQRVPPGYVGDVPYTQDTTFRAYDAMQVRIRDLSKIGPVIDTAMAHGILDISQVSFGATNVDGDQKEALRAATVDARAQAEIMAKASGVQLGRLLSISTEAPARSNTDWDAVITTSFSEAGVGDRGTRVILPLVPVSSTVYATWELRDPK